MKHEKTQGGNPNQLTIDGHILPRASIERFEDASQMVEVQRGSNTFRADSRNAVFCAKRVWDQKAEDGYLTLESSFQELAGKVVADPTRNITGDENNLASMFFALVCARTIARRNPIPDVALESATPVSSMDKDSLEKLEKIGYVTLNQKGEIPGRMIAGPLLQRQMDYCMQELGQSKWHIAISDSLEFLVSDSIDRVPVIPISPSLMLRLDKGGVLTKVEVADHNTLVRKEHDTYFFGRELSKT